MARTRKYVIGDLYRVRILDHCLNQDELITFDVVGYLYKNSPKSITLTHWMSLDDEWRDHSELSTIIKSAIIELENITNTLKIVTE